ncbi:GNAT family N-acetyltransferase [Winogradskyella sp.]|uniref:GNAT family N-acetyltransferase n=1 Tax=Winogradskyella sp. TaxID=1883156 RepID=UPI00261DDB5D|nr:N-acetyltransferase [Winogradskyella sp.]
MKYLQYSGQKDEDIIQLFKETFNDSEGEDEGKLISNLVSDFLNSDKQENIRVFVSVNEDKIIGCIIFSKIQFEQPHVRTFILSPVAVATDYHGKGVGQTLINFAHSILRDEGVQIVLTYGDINFYSKVGYYQISEEIIKAPLKLSYPHGWLAQSLQAKAIQPINEQTFCEAPLNKQEYW